MPYTPLSPSSLELLQVPALAAGGLLINLLSKLAILVVDRDGPGYSTSFRRTFPHSFAPARIGGGLGVGRALACEDSNPSPSARISPESKGLCDAAACRALRVQAQ